LDPESLLKQTESQWFDRKSFRVSPTALADSMIGFANADGGRIVVGISNGVVEGVDSDITHLNELQQAAINFSQPPVRHRSELISCKDSLGLEKNLLLLDIEASETIHRNRKKECFLRIGDENRRLVGAEERELAFDKGESKFDATVVEGVSLADLDHSLIDEYVSRQGASSKEALLRSRGLSVQSGNEIKITQAGHLLMAKVPPIWSYIRYVRYLGTRVETGMRANIREDVTLTGNIPQLIQEAKELISEKLGTVSRLAPSGRFEVMPVLPEFAWLEAIVNAVTHRSYSLQGDGIRVRDFEDRLEIESPGRLPGLVRVKNIRETRYSRNPHIARALAELTGYVRELNEGVERMFEEMGRYGLREPRFEVSDASVRVVLFKQPDEVTLQRDALVAETLRFLARRVGQEQLNLLLQKLSAERQLRTNEIGEILGVSLPTTRSHMKRLEQIGLLSQVLKSSTDPTRYWSVTDHTFWNDI